MPELLDTLSATGLGQLEQPTYNAQLPQVNFNDLNFNANGGNLPKIQGPNFNGDFLGGALTKDDLARVKPETFDNSQARKFNNSSAFQTLGYNKNSNEEDRYDKGQSWGEAAKNAVTKMGLTTWNSFASFFKQNADTFKSISDWNIEDSWKNDPNLKKLQQDAENEILYPSFQSKEGTHWYSFIPFTKGSGDAWESFVPQLGFTLGTIGGAVVENLIVDSLTGGLGAPVEASNSTRKIYDAISKFYTMGKGEATIGRMASGAVVNGLKIGTAGWTMYNAAATEAAMEAGMDYNQTKQGMIQEFKDRKGYAPYGTDLKKIEDGSTSAANGDFGLNIPILMASNAIQFRNILMPSLAKRAAAQESIAGFKLAVEGAGLESKIAAKELPEQTLRNAFSQGSAIDKLGATINYLGHAENLKFLSEGVEESLQRGAATYEQKKETDKFFGEGSNMDALKYAAHDVLTDSGLQEFVWGAMGGLAFQSVGNIAKRFANPKVTTNETGEKEYTYNWLNKLGIFNDDFIKAQRREYAEKLADVMNSDKIDTIFKEEGMKSMFVNNNTSAKMDDYLKKNDIFNVQNLKSDALNRFLYSGLKTGKIDLRMQQLDNLNSLGNTELAALFNVEDSNGIKESLKTFTDYIQSGSNQFEDIYDREKDRFSNQLVKAHKQFMQAKNDLPTVEAKIKDKYKVENADDAFSDLSTYYDALNDRLSKVTDHIEFSNILEEADAHDHNNREKIADRDLLYSHRKNINDAFINYVAVEEGRKAATFAASDMMDSADRARKVIASLQENNNGMRFGESEKLLNQSSVKQERDRLNTYYKALANPTTADQRSQRANLEGRMNMLDALHDEYGKDDFSTKRAAKIIYDYIQSDPLIEKNPAFIYADVQEREAEHKGKLEDLVKLQKRHTENLNLYNRLTTSELFDDYTKYESATIKDFLNRNAELYLSKKDEENRPVEEQTKEDEVVKEQPEQTTQEAPPTSMPVGVEPAENTQGRVDAIKNRLAKGDSLTDEDLTFLASAAILNNDALELYNSYQASRVTEYKPGDVVEYDGTHRTISDTMKHPQTNKMMVSFEDNPQHYVSVDEVSPVQELEAPGQAAFPVSTTPEPINPAEQKDVQADIKSMEQHKSEGSKQSNRTIVNELENKSELSKEQPQLAGGHVAYKQGFLDRIATNDSLSNYEGYLTIDSSENYPEGSPSHTYLKTNPPGIVLKIQDKSGNDKFDANYVASKTGQPLVFSLAPFADKSNMIRLMQDKKIERIPVSLNSISHGMFDVREAPIQTRELLEGINQNDYNLYIAKGQPGDQYFYENGVLLRNGGAYIKTNGSFIKMLPDFARNVLNFPDLVGRVYQSDTEALEIADFLSSMYYTNYENGLSFVVKKAKGGFTIQGKIKADKVLQTADDTQIKEYMKSQRINVMDAPSDFELKLHFVGEDGTVKTSTVPYRQFLFDHSFANKKAYTDAAGNKVLKPINRFLSFHETMDNLYDGLKQAVAPIAQEEKIKEEKGETRNNESLTQENVSLGDLDAFLNEEEKKKREGGEDKDDIRKRLLRAKTGFSEGQVSSHELQFIIDRFGEGAVQKLDDIINMGAYGTWTTSGITLFKDAPAGTGYHEAWHHFSQLYLTVEQKKALYDEARKVDNPIRSLKGLTDLQVEEAMAEDFRAYVNSKGTKVFGETPEKMNIFQKVWRFLKTLFGIKTFSLANVYDDLYRNNINTYKPSINNAMFGKLNSKIVDRNGLEIFNNRKATRYMRYFESTFGQFMAESDLPFSALQIREKNTARDIYSNAYNYINDTITKDFRTILEQERDIHAKTGEHTPMLETLSDFKSLLQNYEDVFKHFLQKSNFTQGAISNDEDFEEILQETDPLNEPSVLDDEEKEANNAGKRWDLSGNEVSVIDAASSETKAFIRTLSKVAVDSQGKPMVEADGKPVLYRNAFGLTEPVNFSQTFNNLAILLEGSRSLSEMISKMKNADNQKKYPEMTLILNRMPSLEKSASYLDISQLVKFYQDFSKTYIPIYTLVRLQDGNYIFKEETKRTRDIINKEWSNNFITTQGENNRVLLDENRRPYLNPETSFNYRFNNTAESIEMLKSLGIEFSQLATQSNDFGKVVNKLDMQRLQDSVNARLKAGQKIVNPVNDLTNGYKYRDNNDVLQEIKSERRIIGALMEMEAKYTNLNPSMSYRTAEGTMQYGLSLNHWLGTNTYSLSRTENYQQILDNPATAHLNVNNNPNIKNSIFLNTLFNLDPKSSNYLQRRTFKEQGQTNAEPIIVQVGNYNGFKQEDEKGNTTGSSTTRLTPRQKIVMDMNSLLSQGAVEIMRTESSASSYFTKLNNYAINTSEIKNLPLTMDELDGDLKNDRLMKVFRGYFEDEINTIINKFNSPLPKYNDPRVGPGRFSLFKEILPESLRDRILQDMKSEAKTPEEKQAITDKIVEKYKNDVDNAVTKFFERSVEGFNNVLKRQNITQSDISNSIKESPYKRRKYGMSEIVKAFVVNDMILNVEFAKLYSGNTAFYKAYHKRSKGDTSTGKTPIIDNFLKGYLDNSHSNTLAATYGVAPQDDITKTKTITFDDDERPSVYTAHYTQALAKLNPDKSAASIEALLKPYSKLNIADGQGHATLDFYRQFRISVGNWSFPDEVQYRKEIIGYRQYRDLYTNLPEGQRELDTRFIEDYKDVTSYFPPVKMQYNGPLDIPGVFAPVLDKFSIAPLLPSVIRDTPWEKRNEEMVRQEVGYSKFESGTKKYKYNTTPFYGVDIPVRAIATHFTENLKEQIETKSKIKEESTWGTQMRKLFMANLFSVGVANQAKFADILSRYKGLLNDVVKEEQGKLYKEFGITEDNGTLNIKDTKNFVDTLQKQVDLRNLNDNIKDSIQYDKDTGKFVYPLEINLNKSAIQDLISGMIFKRLTRLKINGDMLIQVAGTGYESNNFKYTNPSEEENLRYGTNDLPFYTMQYDKDGNPTKTKAMGVKVALIGDFKSLLKGIHTDGQAISTIERLNALLKDEKWREENEDKITMIGYRIPTQGPNSMEFMQVHEFLPEQAGSMILLPAEIVAKAGSDFDIDKMNIFRPSLTASGEVVSAANLAALKERGVKLEEKYQDLRPESEFFSGVPSLEKLVNMLFYGEETDDNVDPQIAEIDKLGNDVLDLISEYRKVEDAKKRMLTNQVMGLYKEVLSSPEMFTQLVTPNNTDLIKPVADAMAKMFGMHIGDFVDTDVYGYVQNLTKFEQLLSGKRDLGVFALANTFSQLLQQNGMKINKTYSISQVSGMLSDVYSRRVTLHLFTKEQRESLASGEQIDFSKNIDVRGNLKQDYFSQLINATVDIAADPYYIAFGLNKETLGVGVYLLHLGLPFKEMVYFINQPVIKNYFQDLVKISDNRVKGSLKNKYLGISDRANAFARAEAIEDLDLQTYEKDDLQPSNLERIIDAYKANTSGYYKNTDDLNHQRRVFAHFLKLQEQSQALRDLQTTMNFDTTKFLTPISTRSNLNLRSKVKGSDLFDSNVVDSLYNDSMISAFNNLEKNQQIFETLMPVGMSKAIIDRSAKLMESVYGDRNKRLKFERILNNDWVEFIVKNFAKIGDTNFERYSNRYLYQSLGYTTLADRLSHLKALYPELGQFSLMSRLFPNFSTKNVQLKNVELYRGLDNTSEFQNILIEEYNILKSFAGNEIPGRHYDESDVRRIRDFFRELQFVAFQQSGFNRSPISMVDIVPHEELSHMFADAVREYNKFVNINPEIEPTIIDIFTDLFAQNNPKFELTPEPGNREPWRGKQYNMRNANQASVALLQQQMLAAGDKAGYSQQQAEEDKLYLPAPQEDMDDADSAAQNPSALDNLLGNQNSSTFNENKENPDNEGTQNKIDDCLGG